VTKIENAENKTVKKNRGICYKKRSLEKFERCGVKQATVAMADSAACH